MSLVKIGQVADTREHLLRMCKCISTRTLHIYWSISVKLDVQDLHTAQLSNSEMKLLRPLAVYTLYDHKTNNSILQELRITIILDNYKYIYIYIFNFSQSATILLVYIMFNIYNIRTTCFCFMPSSGPL